jgi:hypothetical protein
MASRKGVKLGRRVAVSWGSKKIKVKGRQVVVPLVSMMAESVFARTKLKEFKFATTLKITKDKKGKERIASQGVTRSASRYVLAWFGETSPKSKQKVWHRIPVPSGVSLTLASKRLQAAKGSTIEVRWPSTQSGRQARLKDQTKGASRK